VPCQPPRVAGGLVLQQRHRPADLSHRVFTPGGASRGRGHGVRSPALCLHRGRQASHYRTSKLDKGEDRVALRRRRGFVQCSAPAWSRAAAFGYQAHEFFISGTARAYQFSGPPGLNGRWRVGAAGGSYAPFENPDRGVYPERPSACQRNGHLRMEQRQRRVRLPARPDRRPRRALPGG